MRKVFTWIMLKNPAGLACLLAVLGVGAVYFVCAMLGLLGDVDLVSAAKLLGVASLVGFFGVPLLIRLFGA